MEYCTELRIRVAWEGGGGLKEGCISCAFIWNCFRELQAHGQTPGHVQREMKRHSTTAHHHSKVHRGHHHQPRRGGNLEHYKRQREYRTNATPAREADGGVLPPSVARVVIAKGSTGSGVHPGQSQGGGGNAVAGIGKKCRKMRKKCGKCEKKSGIKCGFAKMLEDSQNPHVYQDAC